LIITETELSQTDLNIHEALIDECRRGNRKAQFRLYELYSRAMYNAAYRILNNREEAEDMLQEAFTECFRNISSFRSDSTFGAWLKKIVVNRCINRLRKRETELVYIDDYMPVEHAVEEEPAVSWPDASVISKAVEQLPDGYRAVFSLYLLEGYDHSEISQIMNISESTSKTQYLRAKEKLKKILLTTRRNG
jgi:RNA polymerase sigma-70 factor (ECF subfamily)